MTETEPAAPLGVRDDGGIRFLIIDNPPVNALAQEVRAALFEALEQADADPAVRAVVLMGAGRSFVGGADIREFGKPRQPPRVFHLIARMEEMTKPVVAAIHGVALGGGLELALGCHYRVVTADARLGLPEVTLGLLPGAGGSQLLPRLVGLEQAIAMITSGEPVGGRRAVEIGLADHVVEGDLAVGAAAFAGARAADPLPRVRDLPFPPIAPEAFEALAEPVRRRAGQQRSPIACIEAIGAGLQMSFEQALAFERRLFEELEASEQCAALRHAFFATREAARAPSGTERSSLRTDRVTVVGAGTMGGGIAMCFANAGLPVRLVEPAAEALARGMANIRRAYDATVARGRLTAADVEARLALIAAEASTAAALRDADVVIEAVFEDLALKQDVFADLDRGLPAPAILASNTSTLSIDAIAAATGSPERVVGMHFFSPANVMKLVEVVRGEKSDPQVVASIVALAKRIGKIPVVVGNCDGFVGNRMLGQRTVEVDRMLLQGALPQDIDRVLTGFGFPMGPLAMTDLAGVDVNWRVRQARGQPLAAYDAMYERGRLGQKAGRGFYLYEGRKPVPDPEVEQIILGLSEAAGIERRPIPDEEILERLLFPMINEGARILAEGIAARPGDIDVIWVHGYGWPAWRGGPMFHADRVGLDHIRRRLAHYHERFGLASLAPAPLLVELADAGRGFGTLAAAFSGRRKDAE
ncbi:3-hydroxyacyl-CoA dehydrogenase NAD-binding domain-containing protein [Devosia sp.]|uniref:3-hydroxyacyl-CoA dehydrogenase NAD-binding domain-containing protein n=1 Tax=Devosia sp. TaxID=1871048 RepID=UPI002EF54638